MFRSSSCILVMITLMFSCGNKEYSHEKKSNAKKFDTSLYLNDNQNARVLNFLKDNELLSGDSHQEFYFVNNARCSGCVKNKFEDIVEMLNQTTIKTVVVISDSSFYRTVDNDKVSFELVDAETLKKYNIFHYSPFLYVYENEKIKDQDLSGESLDSLLNRFN